MKLIVLVKELSKLLLKYRFIKKENHNKNNNIKDLFLVKKKSLFLKEQTKNNNTIKIVLRFIIKLPNRKVIGNIDKKKQIRFKIYLLSIKFKYFNILFDNFLKV